MLQNNAQEQYKNLPDHVLFDHNDFRHELIAQEPMKSQQYTTAKSKPIMATSKVIKLDNNVWVDVETLEAMKKFDLDFLAFICSLLR